MMKNKITNCYQLPWSEFDNPNGWIEPISTCNIYCPGCYRGTGNTSACSENLPLDELKKQVDWFKKYRNIHTLSIAGGEPTLYPHLCELIAYATSLNLRTMLFTNGLALTRGFAEELAKSGLNQVVVHVDRFQIRPDMKSVSAIELRQQFVDRLCNIPGLQLGFIQPVSQTCESEIASLMEFLKLNFSAVNLMIFTIYRNICETGEYKPEIENKTTIPDLLNLIQKYATIEPAAYLKSVNDEKVPTWLFAQRMGMNNTILGNVSASLYKLAHKKYRAKNKRYLFISRTNMVKITSLLKVTHRISVLRILANYIIQGFKTGKWNNRAVNFQTFLLLRGPEKLNGKWDLCDGCPDRMIYKGKILPSCILENLKSKNNAEFNNVSI